MGEPHRHAHGTRDEIVPVERSRELATALRARGWSVSLDEPDVDHAGIVLTEYDPVTRRCLPSQRPDVAATRATVVDAIVAMTG